MSPASYQTAPPRDVCFKNLDFWPILQPMADRLVRPLRPRGPSGPYAACCRPATLRADASRAGNGTRTRDPNLGKVVLYQLSYSREADDFSVPPAPAQRPACAGSTRPKRDHGGEGDRTPDLVNAIHALSQLSYAPAKLSRLHPAPPQHGNVAAVPPSVNDRYTGRARSNALVSTVIRKP